MLGHRQGGSARRPLAAAALPVCAVFGAAAPLAALPDSAITALLRRLAAQEERAGGGRGALLLWSDRRPACDQGRPAPRSFDYQLLVGRPVVDTRCKLGALGRPALSARAACLLQKSSRRAARGRPALINECILCAARRPAAMSRAGLHSGAVSAAESLV